MRTRGRGFRSPKRKRTRTSFMVAPSRKIAERPDPLFLSYRQLKSPFWTDHYYMTLFFKTSPRLGGLRTRRCCATALNERANTRVAKKFLLTGRCLLWILGSLTWFYDTLPPHPSFSQVSVRGHVHKMSAFSRNLLLLSFLTASAFRVPPTCVDIICKCPLTPMLCI